MTLSEKNLKTIYQGIEDGIIINYNIINQTRKLLEATEEDKDKILEDLSKIIGKQSPLKALDIAMKMIIKSKEELQKIKGEETGYVSETDKMIYNNIKGSDTFNTDKIPKEEKEVIEKAKKIKLQKQEDHFFSPDKFEINGEEYEVEENSNNDEEILPKESINKEDYG